MKQYPLTLDGVRTRVLDAGHAEQAVVFVHGLSTRADRWKYAIEAAADHGLRAIAFDLPGHGLADKPAGFDYSSPALATYTLRLLDALGISRAHIVGTSLGGHIAALAALQAPARCASLYLVAPLGLTPIETTVAEAIRDSVGDASVAGVRAKLRKVFVDPSFATEDLVVEESRINGSAGAAEALGALADYIVAHLNRELVLDDLAALSSRLPIGLLWGERDVMVPVEIGHTAARALGLPALPVMPDTGHAPYVERPEEFLRHWLAFAQPAGRTA